MYTNNSIGAQHLTLFGASGQQNIAGPSWGDDTRSVFIQPISAANETAPGDNNNLSQQKDGTIFSFAATNGDSDKDPLSTGYFDWVNSMTKYSKTANTHSTSSELEGTTDSNSGSGSTDSASEVQDQDGSTSTSDGNDEGSTDTSTGTSASSGSMNTDQSSGGGGLLGGLLGL